MIEPVLISSSYWRPRDREGICWLVRAALPDEPRAQEKLSMMFAGGEMDGHGTVIPVDFIQADLRRVR